MFGIELRSARIKRTSGNIQDVYEYDEIPQNVRVQIVNIADKLFSHERMHGHNFWPKIYDVYKHEKGILHKVRHEFERVDWIKSQLINSYDIDETTDLIELFFTVIYRQSVISGFTRSICEKAIDELNYRLKAASIGYEFQQGELIRIDNKFIHKEAVKPVLQVLSNDPIYEGANQEFLSAHAHYRLGNLEESLTDCLKSFESLLKAICTERGWEFKDGFNAQRLINIVLENGLIPDYLQTQFSSFKGMLESGVPTIRNKQGGHGQGVEIRVVDPHLVSYMLHITASNLLFLAECNQKLRAN